MTSVGIMQPYFFPYIGYFQLINHCDAFVIYDNIKYTKKGWINRNRILSNGKATVFSLPLKKDSDRLDVRERFLSEDFDKSKLLNRVREAYRKAPFFREVFPLVEELVLHEDINLFGFVHNSVCGVCRYLGISTPIIRSSDVEIEHGLKGQDRVIAICRALNADIYVNPIGGVELYGRKDFQDSGLDLRFLKTENVLYRQFGNEFVDALSMIDVLMFNSRPAITEDLLARFSLGYPDDPKTGHEIVPSAV